MPLALRGKDVAGQSQTGTGKTAAFLIAAFTRCLTHPPPPRGATAAPRVLIIAPTRELVVQIEADARLLGAHAGFRILAVYGGIDYNKQRDALRDGVDVLVGTPGRLIDYLKQHIWSPNRVEVLVIDEADRMFDMGFIADLRYILRRLPKPERRQSFLFSATLSFRVLELTWEFMNNPTQITITPKQKTVEKAEQVLYHVGREEKFNLLLGLLKREGGSRILIFSNTREEARRLEDRLSRNGWLARALTGDVDQKKRLRILADFKDGTLPVLVATDVASRGPAHRGREPRHQLGPAPGRGGLRPPDRPHRPRRRGGQGHQPGRRGERAAPRADRAVHRPEDPRRVGRRRALSAGDQADERGAPPLCGGEAPAHGRPRWPASRRPRRLGRTAGRSLQRALGRGKAPPEPGALTAPFELCLPVPERVRAAGLAAEWSDFLYVPGRGFTSPIEPGLHRSSFVVALATGRAVRVSSFVVPAFGAELCRLRLEPLVSFRPENLGSFFEPARRGMIYAMSADRSATLTRSPDRPGWSYDGPSLRSRLARVAKVHVVRERVHGGSGDAAFSWVADRGLALTGANGQRCLLLANPEDAEQALFTPRLGFYGPLLDPDAPPTPGAAVKDLLGYADRPDLTITTDLIPLPDALSASPPCSC